MVSATLVSWCYSYLDFSLQRHVSLTTRLGPNGLDESTANDAAVARAFSEEENWRRDKLNWKGNTCVNVALLFEYRGVPKQIVQSRLTTEPYKPICSYTQEAGGQRRLPPLRPGPR